MIERKRCSRRDEIMMGVLHLRQATSQSTHPAVVNVGQIGDAVLVRNDFVIVSANGVTNDVPHAFGTTAVTSRLKKTIKRPG